MSESCDLIDCWDDYSGSDCDPDPDIGDPSMLRKRKRRAAQENKA